MAPFGRSLVAWLLLLSCRNGEPRNQPKANPPDDVTARAAKWSATSPPPTRSCGSDPDCGVFVVAPGDDPCCDVTVTAAALNVHYVRANVEWRATNCAAVSCPPLALPGARPAACAFEGRCKAGTCSNACDEVTPRSGLPAGSPGRLDCDRDDDCAVVGLAPSITNPCCDGSAIPTPVGRRYLEAVQAWRPAGCKEVTCPARDTSSVHLSDCAMAARCVAHKCVDACPE